MLDALAVVALQELLDLGVVVLALVQGDADRLVGGDHGLGEQARRLALDVEILLLLEGEDVAVEARPGAHLAATHIVGQVVEKVQADVVLALLLFPALDLVPGVIEGAGLAIGVDEVQQRAADTAQHIGAFAQGAARMGFGRLGAARDGAVIGGLRIIHAEGHAVGRGAVFAREFARLTRRGAVDQEGDVALLQAHDIGARIHMGLDKAHGLQLLDHGLGFGAGELDELEAVHAQGVLGGGDGGVRRKGGGCRRHAASLHGTGCAALAAIGPEPSGGSRLRQGAGCFSGFRFTAAPTPMDRAPCRC